MVPQEPKSSTSTEQDPLEAVPWNSGRAALRIRGLAAAQRLPHTDPPEAKYTLFKDVETKGWRFQVWSQTQNLLRQ